MAVETHDGSYYRARYYDPSTGRFLSEDPIQFSGGLNFYPYVEYDPINLTDETGMAPSSCKAKKPYFAQLRFRPVESPWEAAASGATHSFGTCRIAMASNILFRLDRPAKIAPER